MNNDAIRREVYLILADYPEIELTPSDEGCTWDVGIPDLDLFVIPSVTCNDWRALRIRVLACKAAVDAVRKEMNQEG
jgi:hypothetical protein